VSCKGDKWTKYQGDNIFTNQVTACQVHATEKAVRPLFADQVTIDYIPACKYCCPRDLAAC